MLSNNSGEPDRSRNKLVKQANRAKLASVLFKGAGVGCLGALMWLAIAGHFKGNVKYAIALYLASAAFMFVGTSFQEKHQDIIKTLNKKNCQR